MTMNKLLTSSILLFLFYLPANADTIIFKDGRTMQVANVWKDENQVKCYRFGSLLGFPEKDVERIDISPPEEREAMALTMSGEPPTPPESSQPDREPPSLAQKDLGDSFKVVKVFDGDTLVAKHRAMEIKVRLIGIDAPETGNRKRRTPAQPYSKKSKEFLEKAVLGKSVRIRTHGADQYNRQLGEVFVDGRNINLELLRAGLAEVYQGKMEKTLDADAYRQAEAEARNSLKGMWRQGERYVSPKKWRSFHRKR